MMKNGKNEIKPGDWFVSGGKGLLLEKIENDNAIVRDLKGNTFVYGLETFKRILNEIGYVLSEDKK